MRLLLVLVLLVQFSVRAQPHLQIPASDFRLPTPAGDSVSLSSYRGKVVLLDFWASWCAPCRVANKSLVKIYPRLKEKGVVVISISLDENRKPWLEAVKKDRLGWLQLREVRGWYASVTTDWAVNKIPATFLIDQEGNVVGRDLAEADLEKKINELIQ
jgi:thiol-disulfide isomerase/thioredoxin